VTDVARRGALGAVLAGMLMPRDLRAQDVKGAAVPPPVEPTDDAVVRRLNELGVRVRNQPVALGDLPALSSLRLSGSRARQFTDADVALLRRLPRLLVLGLAGATRLSEAGIAGIARLPSLTFIDLGMSPVGDEGLRALAEAPALTALVLTGSSGITDDGVAHLRRIDRLRVLNLTSQAALTDAGVAAAMAATGRHPRLAVRI
jgi:hypothetical protein